eukprot:CAMPEP_0174250636 /NCGR_PEP_ID=MMETSP0439-20130205/749_1 /TAXON_ID=0 /ORGANISM="Stereomyxa ramosa, Strain Chinc5" /LENGTH=256 /DNA_ID=CAMNT_0015330763 /DNA_START=94 /DNA_END=864 /DNA_ORIENTATION=-
MSGSSVVCTLWDDASISPSKSWADIIEEEETAKREALKLKRQRCTSPTLMRCTPQRQMREKRRRVNSAGKDAQENKKQRVTQRICADKHFMNTLQLMKFPESKVTQKEAENTRVFVGGIPFNDLAEIEKKYKLEAKDKATDMPLWEIRVKCVLMILREFGEVVKMKLNRRRRHCVFVFADAACAKAAIEGLSVRGSRVKKIKTLRANLRAAGLPTDVAPSAKFYVRWPRDNPVAAASSCLKVVAPSPVRPTLPSLD